jgi:hypothetical protein
MLAVAVAVLTKEVALLRMVAPVVQVVEVMVMVLLPNPQQLAKLTQAVAVALAQTIR